MGWPALLALAVVVGMLPTRSVAEDWFRRLELPPVELDCVLSSVPHHLIDLLHTHRHAAVRAPSPGGGASDATGEGKVGAAQ